MRLINESGIWIITFRDNGVKKYWIGAAKNLNHVLTHKLSLINKECNTRMVTSLPVEIKELLRRDKERCVESIYAFTDISKSVDYLETDKQDSIAKFLISKLLMEEGYIPCIKYHEEWVEKSEDKFIFLYPRFKQLIAQEEIGIYKASSTHYEICKDFGWEKSNFLYNLAWDNFNNIVKEDIGNENINTEEVNEENNTIVLKDDKGYISMDLKLFHLLQIEATLQDIELKKLLENLISDKAKEIYKIIE